MELYYKKQVTSDKTWITKGDGVIFVDKEENIDIVFNYLVNQDEYFAPKKNLIKVIPHFKDNIIENKSVFYNYLECVGKTDIYSMDDFMDFCKINKIKVLVISNPIPVF